MPNDLPDWFTGAPVAQGSLTVAAPNTGTLTINTPVGTSCVSVLMAGNRAPDVTASKLQGSNSGVDYASVSVGPTGIIASAFSRLKFLYLFAVDSATDPQVVLTLKANAGTITAFASAWAKPPEGWLFDNQLAPVQLVGNANQVLTPAPDWSDRNKVNGAGTATTNSPASAGKRAVMTSCLARAIANAGRVFELRVWDGASGGTQIGTAWIGNPSGAAGFQPDSLVMPVLASSAGNGITADFDVACVAGERQSITISGSFQ